MMFGTGIEIFITTILISSLTLGVARATQKIYGSSLSWLIRDSETKFHEGTFVLWGVKTGLWTFGGNVIGAFYFRRAAASSVFILMAGMALALIHIRIVNMLSTHTGQERPIHHEILGGLILIVSIGVLLSFLLGGKLSVLGLKSCAVVGMGLGGAGFFVRLLVLRLSVVVELLVSSILILWCFRRILCNHCLCYTSPLRSHYKHGRRYCEHCQKEVEYTHEPGRVIFTFGNVALNLFDRAFIFSDPDFEGNNQPVAVSEIYIDTTTCNARLVERMITFLVEHTPKRSLKSVQIFYRGDLKDLGNNLCNALRNNFPRLRDYRSTSTALFE